MNFSLLLDLYGCVTCVNAYRGSRGTARYMVGWLVAQCIGSHTVLLLLYDPECSFTHYLVKLRELFFSALVAESLVAAFHVVHCLPCRFEIIICTVFGAVEQQEEEEQESSTAAHITTLAGGRLVVGPHARRAEEIKWEQLSLSWCAPK